MHGLSDSAGTTRLPLPRPALRFWPIQQQRTAYSKPPAAWATPVAEV